MAAQKPSPFPEKERAKEKKTAVRKGAGDLASFCGREMDGRQTATGEFFDSNALTAAHAKFPLGSVVQVTNLANGRSVMVRINDRIRAGGAIVMTIRAAEELDFVAAGSARVKLERAE